MLGLGAPEILEQLMRSLMKVSMARSRTWRLSIDGWNRKSN